MKTEQGEGAVPVRVAEIERDPYQRSIRELDGQMADLFGRYRNLFERTRTDGEEVLVGRERVVLVRDDHVLKFPLNDSGVITNAYESDYKSDHVPLADCEIIFLEGLP